MIPKAAWGLAVVAVEQVDLVQPQSHRAEHQ